MPTTLQKKRRLPFALAGGATNNVFVYLCFFGPVFPLFLDSLDLDKAQIGLLMALLPFCGLIAPFVGGAAARIGFKRTFLIFYTARKFTLVPLIAIGWILHRQNPTLTFYYVAGTVAVFGLLRATAETAHQPWHQEYVPAATRGRFTAFRHVVSVVAGVITITAASYVIGEGGRPSDYTWLFVVALGVGLASALIHGFIPGGAPVRDTGMSGSMTRSIGVALRDRGFLLFMAGTGVVILGLSPVDAFVPLFMKEQVQLASAVVVRLESVALAGGLASCFLWGWAVDRFGSKPAIVLTPLLMALYPLGLILMPREAPWNQHAAIGLSLAYGLVRPGWVIAFGRHLFVNVVPEHDKIGYLALYFAWVGLIGGLGPLIAGHALEATVGLDQMLGFVHIGPYTPLFAVGVLMAVLAAGMFSLTHVDGAMGTTRFALMFFQGNPFAAMHAVIVHSLARDEGQRISAIERLGQTRSPLNVDELIAALQDPSYQVRMEAIVSMARTRPDPRLTEALLKVIAEPEPDLALAAVWALGRIGDGQAVERLRGLLLGNYPLMAARSARSLAQLGDSEVIPLLTARLRDELDDGLRIAYASALGSLRCTDALPEILAFLDDSPSESARRELALAAARIVNDEHYLIRLWRRLEPDRATATSEALLALRRRMVRDAPNRKAMRRQIDLCIQLLADDDLPGGIAHCRALIEALPTEQFDPPSATVLKHAAAAMARDGEPRIEYLLLMLHALNAHFNPPRQANGAGVDAT